MESSRTKSPEEKTQPAWRNYIGIILAVAASAQYSLGLVLAQLSNDFNPFMITFWMYLGMYLIIPFVIYARVWKQKPIFNTTWPMAGNIKNISFIVIICISGTVCGALQVCSLQYISLPDSSTIVFSTPVFVTLVSHWVLREKIGIVQVLCGAVALLGVVIITRPPMFTGKESFDTETLIGAALATGSMVSLGAFFVVLRALSHVHFAVITLFSGIWGTFQSAVVCPAFSQFQLPVGVHDWLLTCAVALLYFLPEICLTLALKFEEAGTVALFQTFDILFAFLWEYMLLGVSPDWISCLGGFVVVSGVLLAALRKYIAGMPLESKLRVKLWFLLK